MGKVIRVKKWIGHGAVRRKLDSRVLGAPEKIKKMHLFS